MDPNLSNLARPGQKEAVRQHGTVSVVIPALNEERFLGRCLESLTRLEFPQDALEVIVVDNGSTDGTLTIAHSFAQLLNLKILEKKGASIAALRNLGAAASTGDLLAFLDADCMVPSCWLTAASEVARTPGWGVVGAPYLIPDDSSWVARIWYRHQHRQMRGEVPFVGACNLIISRRAFAQTGGFDPTLETNEDYEFCRRVAANGLSIVTFPPAAVVHLGNPQSLASFFRRERWHGKHVFRVFLRSLSKLPNARAVAYALYTLVCVIGAAGGGIEAMLGGSPLLLTCSLTALLGAPLILSLRATISSRAWSDVLPLAVLFFTYGIARALCLLDSGTRPPRKTIDEAVN
jgi:glycosyltransferase involved in cell wall biosynthesis